MHPKVPAHSFTKYLVKVMTHGAHGHPGHAAHVAHHLPHHAHHAAHRRHHTPQADDTYYQQTCALQLGAESIENGIGLRRCPPDAQRFCFGHLGRFPANEQIKFTTSCTRQQCPEGSVFSAVDGHCVPRER